MRNPVIRLVRRYIGPGSTEHNGRGQYYMFSPFTDSEVWGAVLKLLSRHSDKIAYVVTEDFGDNFAFHIHFNSSFTKGELYNTFSIVWPAYAKNRQHFSCNLSVTM